MKLLEKRIQKLEKASPSRQIKWIMVMQYEGESHEDALRFAGYPIHEECRGVMFYQLVISHDKKTGKNVLTKRDPSERISDRFYNPEAKQRVA